MHEPWVEVLEMDQVFFGRGTEGTEVCVVQRVARERWSARSLCQSTRASLPYHALLFVVSGAGTFRTRGRVGALRPGMVICCGPKTEHEIAAEGPHGLGLTVVEFEGTRAEDLIREHLGDGGLAFEVRDPYTMSGLLDAMLAVAKRGEPLAREVCGAYLTVLLLTLQSGLLRSRAAPTASEATFHACKRLLDKHFATLRSAAEAAKRCRLTPAYLCRLFRRHAGVTPYTYLLRLKMNYAAYLLRRTGGTVKDVAVRLGYDDPRVFSKAFRRVQGMPPGACRQGSGAEAAAWNVEVTESGAAGAW